MKLKKSILFSLALIFLSIIGKAQVSVVNVPLQPYNITPESMLSASIMNSSLEQQVFIIAKLYNSNNEQLLTVKSATFILKLGLNTSLSAIRTVSSIEYATSEQANYIRTTHGLPGGAFKICVQVVFAKNLEIADEFCDEIESEFNQYLYLVFPSDKDTIETTSPLLTWAHNEPFNVLAQGEYFRMIVTEIKDKQSPEEAISINTPLMAKNYLTSHNLQYPYDAKELLEGKQYVWQVQKLTNGVVTNQTEAWEFTIRKKPEEKEIKYVALKEKVDANFYTAFSGKIFFKFNEEYISHQGNIVVFIKADNGKEFPVTIVRDDVNSKPGDGAKVKVIGDNRFVLDLNNEKIKSGYYTMCIKNEKKETFYLKFYLPR